MATEDQGPQANGRKGAATIIARAAARARKSDGAQHHGQSSDRSEQRQALRLSRWLRIAAARQ